MSMTVIQKLEKCKASIAAHIKRGAGLNSQRGYELVDRYEGLRLAAYELKNSEWAEYCKANDMAVGHDGYDLFAK
jgi:hypothetical protein